ncbi:succinylglutamate desuccinylase [Thaumasiovibrio sp. DFM-14]|uniref:succinylglutamate desuccinylase n=1 Tax=Thaumasiovibrio sp. DFM-14 TaxID=3384792 RepID=UPI0039A1A290
MDIQYALNRYGFAETVLRELTHLSEAFVQQGHRFHCLGAGVIEVAPLNVTRAAVIVSVGVHGDETGPIELVDALFNDLLQGKLTLRKRVLFILAHPEAVKAHTRFIDTNLNRLFGGQGGSTLEHLLARNLTAIIRKFYVSAEERWHLDLHSAIRDSHHYAFAVRPFTTPPLPTQQLFCFLFHAGVEAVLESTTPSSTFSWHSAHYHRALAVTVELGQAAPFGRNELLQRHPFRSTLTAFIEDKLDLNGDEQPLVYVVNRVLTRKSNNFKFDFPSSLANFTLLNEGQRIATNGDVLITAQAGEMVVFPNPSVPIGQRAALLVVEKK